MDLCTVLQVSGLPAFLSLEHPILIASYMDIVLNREDKVESI